MRPSFYPRLVNDPFDDPCLFLSFLFEKRAILFDLGDTAPLSSKDILKLSHVFVSHTHMDHFIGFDRLLRLFLGRDKTLYLFGPKGILRNIEGKLAGYEWNLVENYSNPFRFRVAEVDQNELLFKDYPCQNRFQPPSELQREPFSGILLEEPGLIITAAILDHAVPCLGFTIEERFHINIIKNAVEEMGFEIGPWLKEFKQALFMGKSLDSEFYIECRKNRFGYRKHLLGELAKKIARITPGQKISYVTDVVYSASNVDRIVRLAENADHLFIEAAFLEKDRKLAEKKFHLTARQAGIIAKKARVKQFSLFHFSPRYTGNADRFHREAMDAYGIS